MGRLAGTAAWDDIDGRFQHRSSSEVDWQPQSCLDTPAKSEARNAKSETNSKHEWTMTKVRGAAATAVWDFQFASLGFVSDFEIRISSLSPSDGLGSVVALSDAAGDVAVLYEYGIYGQVAASDPNHPNPFLFTGREFDKETGLYYYRARYYNPYIGRFLQTDPAGEGMNTYAYCRDNPIRWVDPSGRESKAQEYWDVYGIPFDLTRAWEPWVDNRDNFLNTWNQFVADVEREVATLEEVHGACHEGVNDGARMVLDGMTFWSYGPKEVMDPLIERYGDTLYEFAYGCGTVAVTCTGIMGGMVLIEYSPVVMLSLDALLAKAMNNKPLDLPTIRFDWTRSGQVFRSGRPGTIFTNDFMVMQNWVAAWEKMVNDPMRRNFTLGYYDAELDAYVECYEMIYAGFKLWAKVGPTGIFDAGRTSIPGGR